MPYVKLDCDMLASTTWLDREAREMFLTALLMAQPYEAREPQAQLEIRSLEPTGWSVPIGWYGFVHAASSGIIHMAGADRDNGLYALDRLGAPEPDSRSQKYEGRRLVRVDGGFIVLNYMKFREKDYTTAERSRRYREKKRAEQQSAKAKEESQRHTGTSRDVTEAEAEAEADTDMVSNAGSTTPSISLVPTKDHPLTAQSVLSTLEHLTEQSDIQKTLRTWQIRAIFAYWVKVMKKDNKRVLLSKERWVRIDKYLRLYQIEACLYAIDGALTHPDLNHESGRSYHELEQIFLKGSDGPGRVEKLSDYAERRHRKRKHRLLKAHPQLEGKEPNGTTPGDDEGRDPRGSATPDAGVGGSGSEAKPGTSHQPRDRSASSGADSDGDDSGNADSESSGSDRG